VDAGEYADVDLIERKIYEVWPDADAEAHGELRVVDESGEDYLFPAECFRILSLPPGVDRLIRASRRPPARPRRAASKGGR
jgi:hypothetical protein